MNNWIAKVSIFLLIVLLLHTVINLTLKTGSDTNLKIPKTEKSKNETETESEVQQDEEQQPYDNNFADFESPEDDDLLNWFNNEVEEKISDKPFSAEKKDDDHSCVKASNSTKNNFDDDEKNSNSDSLGVYKQSSYEYAPFSK
jgi:hypothetical protein